MHILLCALYSAVIWLAGLGYCVIVDGPWLHYLALSPFVLSGIVIALYVVDALAAATCRAWRTRRLRRASPAASRWGKFLS